MKKYTTNFLWRIPSIKYTVITINKSSFCAVVFYFSKIRNTWEVRMAGVGMTELEQH